MKDQVNLQLRHKGDIGGGVGRCYKTSKLIDKSIEVPNHKVKTLNLTSRGGFRKTQP